MVINAKYQSLVYRNQLIYDKKEGLCSLSAEQRQ